MFAIKHGRGTLNAYADNYKGIVFAGKYDNNHYGEIVKKEKKINQNVFINDEAEQPTSHEDIILANRLNEHVHARLNMIQNMPAVAAAAQNKNINTLGEGQQMQQLQRSSSANASEEKVPQKDIGEMQVSNENKQSEQMEGKEANQSKEVDYIEKSPGILEMRKHLNGLEDEEEEVVIEKSTEKDTASSSSAQGTSANKRRSKSISSSRKRKRDRRSYNVEAIRDERFVGTVKQYLIKWESYSEDENTWEPAKNFEHFDKLIADFDKTKNKGTIVEPKEEKKSPVKAVEQKKSPVKAAEQKKSPVKTVKQEEPKKSPVKAAEQKKSPVKTVKQEEPKKSPVKAAEQKEEKKSPARGTKRKSAVMSTSYDSSETYKLPRFSINYRKTSREELSKKLHTPSTPTARGGAKQQRKESLAGDSGTPTKKADKSVLEASGGKKKMSSSKKKDKQQPQELDDNVEMVPETPQIPLQNVNTTKDFVTPRINQQPAPAVDQNGFGFQRGLRPKAVLKRRTGLHGDGDDEFLVEYEGEPNKEWVSEATFLESGPLAQSLMLAFLSKSVGKIFREMVHHDIPVDEFFEVRQ